MIKQCFKINNSVYVADCCSVCCGKHYRSGTTAGALPGQPCGRSVKVGTMRFQHWRFKPRRCREKITEHLQRSDAMIYSCFFMDVHGSMVDSKGHPTKTIVTRGGFWHLLSNSESVGLLWYQKRGRIRQMGTTASRLYLAQGAQANCFGLKKYEAVSTAKHSDNLR